jgi:hypothetical protein
LRHGSVSAHDCLVNGKIDARGEDGRSGRWSGEDGALRLGRAERACPGWTEGRGGWKRKVPDRALWDLEREFLELLVLELQELLVLKLFVLELFVLELFVLELLVLELFVLELLELFVLELFELSLVFLLLFEKERLGERVEEVVLGRAVTIPQMIAPFLGQA